MMDKAKNKMTWLVTYLNGAAEVVTGDRMGIGSSGLWGEEEVYHFWDDQLSFSAPFLVVNARNVSSIRLQAAEVRQGE